MKKFIFTMVALFATITMVNAQTAVETQKFLDNTYVGIGLGVSTPLTFNSVFPLNPSVNVTAGKRFTPVYGVRIDGSFITGDNFGFGHPVCVSNTFFRGVNVGVNGTVNLTNLIAGYTGVPRKIEISTVTGLGYGHIFNSGTTDPQSNYYVTHRDDLTARTGIDIAFNIGSSKAFTAYVQPAVLWNLTAADNSKVQFNKQAAQLSLSAGIVYNFNTTNGTRYFKTYDVGAMTNEINALRAENEALKNAPAKVVKETIIKETVKVNDSQVTVPFDVNSSIITAAAKAILDKVPADATVTVTGCASPDGSVKRNTVLADERAQAVRGYLESRGVKVTKANGGEAGRIAVVTLE